jgi:hypothetical protein
MSSVDAPSNQENQEAQALDQNFELRRILNQALGAVQGRQTTESFFALTYEELADQQIERIEGKGTTTRPNELERINQIESDLLNLVSQVRNVPPENFLLSDRSRDVNTPVEPEG